MDRDIVPIMGTRIQSGSAFIQRAAERAIMALSVSDPLAAGTGAKGVVVMG
jgi:hypothetical protein